MTLASAAIAYAKLGLHVFPLAPRSKKTLKGSHGLNDASPDPETIAKWWTEHPDANIGCNAGASGLAVLDADLYKAGAEDGLEDLQEEIGPIPDTWLALTGGGGHQYFFDTKGVPELRSGADCWGVGLDFKASGGYVVLPPSVHPSGRKYEWEASSSPMNARLARIPPELARMRMRREPATEPGTSTTEGAAATHEDLQSALDAIPADGYDHWIEIGMALKHALGSAGYAMWRAWSSKSDKCRPDELPGRWEGFNGSGVTAGTLFHIAESFGWSPPVYTAEDFARDTADWATCTAKAGETPLVEPFPTILVGDIEPQEVRYIVQDLVLATGRGLITGAPGAGKSYLTAEIAVCVAAGVPVLDKLPTEQGTVLVFNAEDDPGTITRVRMGAIAESKGFFDLSSLPIHHINIDSLELESPLHLAKLEETVISTGARLLILDPLRDLHDADEDNSTAMKPILHSLRLLEQRTGAVVIVCHHDKKGTTTGRRESRARGTTAVTGWRSFSIGIDHCSKNDIHKLTPYVKAAASICPGAFKITETGALEFIDPNKIGPGDSNANGIMNSLTIGVEMSRLELELAAGLSKDQAARTIRKLLGAEKIERVPGRNPPLYRRLS